MNIKKGSLGLLLGILGIIAGIILIFSGNWFLGIAGTVASVGVVYRAIKS